MTTISSCIVLFAICSFLGWVFESLLAIVKTRAWEARGFLYGPVCPIYGVGVVAIVLIAKALMNLAGAEGDWWHVALAAFFGSMVLEYVTSWGLEKAFHAYWWDYSDMPLNINGRTCIPAACLFALGGLAAVYVISPAWDLVIANVPALAVEAVAFIIVVLLTIDITLTISSLTRLADHVAAASETFNSNAGQVTATLMEAPSKAVEAIAEQKERLSAESLRGTLDAMPATMRMALRRIQGFRLPERPSAPNLARVARDLLAEAKRRTKR